MYAVDMRWLGVPIQPALFSGWELKTQQMALCIYVNHLANDSGLFCKRIKANTIKGYIRDVAGLLALTGDRWADVRKDSPTCSAMGQYLTRMYRELDRYETAKNRREAFTLSMMQRAIERAKVAPYEDHSDVVLADWYEICLFTGQRKSEWAQPDERNKLIGQYHCNLMGDAYACCMTDIRIETKDKRRMDGVRCLDVSSASDIQFMWIKYRMQKNGSNGEERMYSTGPGGLSFIHAMHRVMKRFRRLLPMSTDLVNPLAIHRAYGAAGPIHFVTPRLIMNHMRSIAAEVFHLNPTADKLLLRRWSTHSLRVAACVLLQEAGFTGPQIKWILRWRSDAFMDYLRNTPGLSLQQAQALNKLTGLMPNIFRHLGVMRDYE
jgi:hypothetical protein